MAEVKKIQEEGKKLAEKYKKDAAIMSAAQKQELEAKIKTLKNIREESQRALFRRV